MYRIFHVVKSKLKKSNFLCCFVWIMSTFASNSALCYTLSRVERTGDSTSIISTIFAFGWLYHSNMDMGFPMVMSDNIQNQPVMSQSDIYLQVLNWIELWVGLNIAFFKSSQISILTTPIFWNWSSVGQIRFQIFSVFFKVEYLHKNSPGYSLYLTLLSHIC